MRKCAAILLVLSVVGFTPVAWAEQGIHVTGSGEVAVAPDLARVTLQVSYRDKDANVAKTEADRVTQSMLDELRRLHVKTKDITAASIRLHPIYARSNDGTQRVQTMQASRDISVVVRNLSKVGDVVNAAVRLGVTHVQNISLDTSRRAELERQALELAIEHARGEAAHVAKQFDVALGGVLDVVVGRHYAGPVVAAQAEFRVRRGDSPFSPGEMVIQRDVQAVFEIQ